VKALTIRQPWASLIAMGVKTIETRSWSTNYRGPLAIHAGASLSYISRRESMWVGAYETTNDTPRRSKFPQCLMRGPMAWPYRMPMGTIVATCELVDVLPMVEALTIGEHTQTERVVQILSSGRTCILDRWRGGGEVVRLLDDELPYGDFAVGRFAWILENVTPFKSAPEKGKRGLWNWEGQ
jgi:hypothetical protein